MGLIALGELGRAVLSNLIVGHRSFEATDASKIHGSIMVSYIDDNVGVCRKLAALS